MKLLKCQVNNFGSFKALKFDYSSPGVILIKGPTGSGKTTFLDIPIWILWGVTSKNGAVDDVCSWFTTNEQTYGMLEVELSSGVYCVHRIRGGKATKNDLFFTTPEGITIRGKDLTETQQLLSKILGFNSDTFALSAYFNEFSESSVFFQASAKERRKLFEKITNLSFAKVLSEKISDKKKTLKKEISEHLVAVERAKASVIQADLSLSKLLDLQEAWKQNHALTISELNKKSETFEFDKHDRIEEVKAKAYKFEDDRERQMGELIDKIDSLDEEIKPYDYFEALLIEAEARSKMEDTFCTACNQLLPEEADQLDEILENKIYNSRLLDRRALYVQEMEKLRKAVNPYSESIKVIKEEKNHYSARLEEENSKISPFIASIQTQEQQVNRLKNDLATSSKFHKEKEEKFIRLNVLSELTSTLRIKLLANTIANTQGKMNSIISEYFDSEFSISLTPEENDSLSVSIQKNGYPCSYSQLSKGQRQILKLTFAVSLMEIIGNEYAEPIQTLFFDEPSDGLDEGLKVKCLELLMNLHKKRQNIYVIEHTSAVHSLFDKEYAIELLGDESNMTEIE